MNFIGDFSDKSIVLKLTHKSPTPISPITYYLLPVTFYAPFG